MTRIGHGFDVHRLVPDRPLILGGVVIPFDQGLLGHSDADCLTHAICDALLGAAGVGDLGHHFPDTDPSLAGIASLEILRRVHTLLVSAGWVVGNVDATVVAQAPRLAPHVGAMVANLAACLNADIAAINVKATTTEGLGFTGDGLGIAAHAVALIHSR
ncbi:MAG: 2-C-methyl-D-erythritol 2,4-cyclodiphosphate synthase [Nitrospirota bacterium]|jgi:2-C-methyl-D-erythritol 2,4-cyclodiphosphate synthase